MSVFNRIEIVNFLNIDGVSPSSRDWRPHWQGVPVSFGGVSTAIKLTNGGGKTSLCDAIYALLTRKSDVVQSTRERCAGNSWGYYTHIRLEVTFETRISGQPRLIGHEVEGERYVFGLYGSFKELQFYHYKGTLEDLPVMTQDGAKQIVVTNSEFDRRRKAIKMICDPGTRIDDWRKHVHDHIDAHTLSKAVEYHVKGGGDGAKALFQVTRTPGGRYDTDFFYEHIAPEVLVGCMQDDGEPDEYHFEDTLVNSSLPLVAAEQKLRRKKRELEDWELLAERLSTANSAVDRFWTARRERQEIAGRYLTEARWIQDAVIVDPLPGIPRPLSPGAGSEQVRFIAGRMVVSDGHWLVPDGLLAELTDESPSAVNQRADRQGVARERLSSQGIENPCDLKISPARKGHPSSGYDRSGATRLVKEAGKFVDGWNRDALLRAINGAFERLEGDAECNPFRRLAREADRELRAAQDHLARAEADKSTAEAELLSLSSRLEQLEIAEAELRRMEELGLFTGDELASPVKAGETVRKMAEDIQQRLEKVGGRRLELAPGRAAYGRVKDGLGDCDPATMLASLRLHNGNADKAATAAGQSVRDAAATLDATRRSLDARNRAVTELERLHADLARLGPIVERFAEVFGDTDWHGLRERIQNEHRQLVDKRAQCNADLPRLAKSAEELTSLKRAAHGYAALFGDESPHGLAASTARALADAESREERLTEDLSRLEEFSASLRGGAAAHAQVLARFAMDDVLVIEQTLRAKERAALAAAGEIDGRVRSLTSQVEALDRFAVEYGQTASPRQVRHDRAALANEVSGEIATLGHRLRERERDIEELRAGGTAAGTMARQAAQVTAAKDRVHDVVMGLGLSDARKRAMLEQFSQVLHAPVYADEDEAGAALRALEDARIDFPVFNRRELEGFCRAEAPQAALLWGRATAAVDALVNPGMVPEWIARAEGECEELGRLQSERRAFLESLAPTASVGRMIEDACRAEEADARRGHELVLDEQAEALRLLAEIESALQEEVVELIHEACRFQRAGGAAALAQADADTRKASGDLAALTAALPGLRRRASTEAAGLIASQLAFISRGGDEAIGEVRERIEGVTQAKLEADERFVTVDGWNRHLDLVDAKTHYEEQGGHARFAQAHEEIAAAKRVAADTAASSAAAGAAHEQALANHETATREAHAAALRLSQWETPLEDAGAYVDAGGVDFDATCEQIFAQLQKDKAENARRMDIRFELAERGAQARRDANMHSQDALRSAELKSMIARLSSEVTAYRNKIDDARTRAADNDKEGRKLDSAAAALLAAWRDADAVLDQLRGEVAPPPGAGLSVHVRTSTMLRDEIRSGAPGLEGLNERLDAIAGNLAQFGLRRGLDEFNTYRKGELAAIRDARREAARIAKDESQLGAHERLRIDPETNVQDEPLLFNIAQLYGIAIEHVQKLQAINRAVSEDVLNCRERLHLSMSGFTRQIRENFRILTKTLKPADAADAAGFVVEARIVDDDQVDAAAHKVVELVREGLEQREMRGKYIGEQTAAEERRYQEGLRARIGREFYRSIFVGPGPNETGPIVKVKHPAISSGGATPLREKFSVGQKNAVFLMAIAKLADFAQERDAMRESGGRRKVRPSRVLLIDGLFSNLSDPKLIKPALEVLKQLRGQFQLIGLIHDPKYENDPTLFPTFVQLRQVGRSRGFILKDREIVDGVMVPLTLRVKEVSEQLQ